MLSYFLKFESARQLIEGGLADCVLAVGFEQMKPGTLNSSSRVNLIQRQALLQAPSMTELTLWINTSK